MNGDRGVQIEVLDDLAAYAARITPALPAADPRLRYFHHPAWASQVWEHIEHARGSRPRLLVAVRENRPVGWWALLLSRRSLGYRLQNLGQEISDYALPYVADALSPELRRAAADALLAAAVQAPREFSFAQFQHMLAEPWQPDAEPADWLARAGAGWRADGPHPNRWIDFAAYGRDPAAYATQRLSTKFRKNLRYEANVLARQGEVQLAPLADGAELDAEWGRYRAWYRYGGAEQEKREAKLAVWWNVFKACAGTLLDASALRVGARTVSLLIGFRRGPHYDLFSLVFDPAFAEFSVGKLHLHRVIERELAAGGAGFHFLTGDDEYKGYWANASYPSWHVRYLHARSLPAAAQWLKFRLGRRGTA